MSKKKQEYLPLRWAKTVKKMQASLLDSMSSDELQKAISRVCDSNEAKAVFDKHPGIKGILNGAKMGGSLTEQLFLDIDAIITIDKWAKNKQVYKINSDFLNELLKTEKLRIEKDALSYLPFQTFYIDISDNVELCKRLNFVGAFISVEEVKKNYCDNFGNNEVLDVPCYPVHICRMNEDYYYATVATIENMGKDLFLSIDSDTFAIDAFDEDGNFKRTEIETDSRAFMTVIIQLLIYLSSVQPDIQESEATKSTYRKPFGEPKNKFSEVRQWDVGYRFGSAFRKWKSSQSAGTVTHGTGTAKRPHSRRAHWHSFWCKTDAGERVLRQKWLAEMFINANPDENEELPATIHNVS